MDENLLLVLALSNKGGGGGGVSVITRTQWDLLSPEAKREYELVSIEDSDVGYHRGELVYGADYSDPPKLINAYSMNGGGVGSLSHTFEVGGEYFIFACMVVGNDLDKHPSTSLNITLNGLAVEDIVYDIPANNNDIRLNNITFTVSVNPGDELVVENVTTHACSGVQLFILKNVAGIELYNSRPNNNTSFRISTNGQPYLQVYRFGYYNGNNFSADRCEIDTIEKDSVAVPNDMEYWYGGTYVMLLTGKEQPSIKLPSVYLGTDTPSNSMGKNGDYYYKRSNNLSGITFGVPVWSLDDSQTSICGYRFSTNAECVAVGLRVYNRASNKRAMTAGLYDSDGNIIEEITTEALSRTWTQLRFTHKHELEIGATYLVMVNFGSTGYASYSRKDYIERDSRIETIDGVYGSIASPTVDNANIYCCDVVLEDEYSYVKITNQYYKANNSWIEIVD